jgi:hypothetical protein
MAKKRTAKAEETAPVDQEQVEEVTEETPSEPVEDTPDEPVEENPNDDEHHPMPTEAKAVAEIRAKKLTELSEALSIFDLEKLTGLLDFLRRFDIGDVGELFSEVKNLLLIKDPIDSSIGLELRVEAALKIFRVYARISETARDDELIEQIDRMLNTGLLPVVCDLVSMLLGHIKPGDKVDEAAINDVMTESVSTSLTEGGLNWSSIIPLIKAIFELIRIFTRS